MLAGVTPSELVGDVVGLLAADVRQRRERALLRGGALRGWQSLVDVAAAFEALAAPGAVRGREGAAMHRAVRDQIARAATCAAPAAPAEVVDRAAALLERSDDDVQAAVVELGLAAALAERPDLLFA